MFQLVNKETRHTMNGAHYYVTGTDTEVGKTFIACGFLALARRQSKRTLGLKPIAAGCDDTGEGYRNEDAVALIRASGTQLAYDEINPIALEPAIAPHIALSQIGEKVSADYLAGHCRRVADHEAADLTLVEGAGGWFVPLSGDDALSDMAQLLNFDVILVIGMKLGCLNHALLTQAAIHHAGLKLAGWVANTVTEEPMQFLEENIETLRYRMTSPCLGVVPYLADREDEAADYLSLPE